MNSWIFIIVWICLRYIAWFSSFAPSERVALFAAFLVLLGVAGEEIAECKLLDDEKRARLKSSIKRWSVGILVLGLAGDLVGVDMGKAEMEALTTTAGGAATSAHNAAQDAGQAHQLAQSASDIAKRAKETAKKAKQEADAVGILAGKLTGRMSATAQELADAEAAEKQEEQTLTDMAVCLAPRVLPFMSALGKTSVDSLRPYLGTQAIIEFVSQDAETRRAASSIAGTLKEAGWNVVSRSPADEIKDGVEIQWYEIPPISSGLQLEERVKLIGASSDSMQIANALVDFLHSRNWEARARWPDEHHGLLIGDSNIIPPGGLLIKVGLYPPVAFAPAPGDK